MTPANQITFETRANGLASVAVRVAYREPLGRGSEQEVLNSARYFYGRLRGAGIAVAPWALQYCADCVIVFLSFPPADLNAALADVLLSFSQFEIESSTRVAVHTPAGSWEEFFPVAGAAFTLPPEVRLLPQRFCRLEAESAQLDARRESLAAALRLGTITDDDAAAQSASIAERCEAVRAGMNDFKRELVGGES